MWIDNFSKACLNILSQAWFVYIFDATPSLGIERLWARLGHGSCLNQMWVFFCHLMYMYILCLCSHCYIYIFVLCCVVVSSDADNDGMGVTVVDGVLVNFTGGAYNYLSYQYAYLRNNLTSATLSTFPKLSQALLLQRYRFFIWCDFISPMDYVSRHR